MAYEILIKKKGKNKFIKKIENTFGRESKISKLRREKTEMILDKGKEIEEKINARLDEKDKKLKELKEQKKEKEGEQI